MGLAHWVHRAWAWQSRREGRRFAAASRDVRGAQLTVLAEVLEGAAGSEFAQRHGLTARLTADEYRRSVPLSTYDDYCESIARIAAGQPRVLTGAPVLLLEPTSGSSGFEKLIPYTALLRAQFQRAIAAWVDDLFRVRPATARGKAYWSVSPAWGPPRRTAGGLAIGFEDDTAYLSGLERLLLRKALATPPELAHLTDLDEFRYRTLLHLVQAHDLSLISVWSPTFLTTLLDGLEPWSERLYDDLAAGGWPARAREYAALAGKAGGVHAHLAELWPHLAAVSCWTDAAAAHYVKQIARRLPQTEILPKGLIATEAFVSIPLVGAAGAALAVRSHFFEFLPAEAAAVAEQAATRLPHEVELGERYEVVVTTGGGLYRYRMGDLVEVVGFRNACPLLRFQGRSGRVCDLVGEKLSEPQVRAAFTEALQPGTRGGGMQPQFLLLAPAPAHYRWFVAPSPGESAADYAMAVLRLEEALGQNPHYRYARGLGQLRPVELVLLAPGGSAWSVFEQQALARGVKAGEIKPVALDGSEAWLNLFREAGLC